jgi:hypothetical protein
MPICRSFLTGATGLEPATSGVTGRGRPALCGDSRQEQGFSPAVLRGLPGAGGDFRRPPAGSARDTRCALLPLSEPWTEAIDPLGSPAVVCEVAERSAGASGDPTSGVVSLLKRFVAPHRRSGAVGVRGAASGARSEGRADRRAVGRAVDDAVADDRARVAAIGAVDLVAATAADMTAGAVEDVVATDRKRLAVLGVELAYGILAVAGGPG